MGTDSLADSSIGSIHGSRSDDVRTLQSSSGMGTEESSREGTNGKEPVCQCAASGLCEARGYKVNELLWRKCQQGAFDAVTKLIEGSKKEHIPTKRKTKPIIISSLSKKIRNIIETEIGYEIKCGACLSFFQSIKDNSTFEEVIEGLLLHSPTPDWWRAKYKNRKARYTELIRDTVLNHYKAKIPKAINPIPPVKDSDWYVAVTTAPRQDPTIEQCLDSIYRCGWEPIVFAEPDSVVVEDYQYVHNSERLGAWHNWLKTMRAALGTDAKYILSAQDDSLFHPDSRKLVEQLMWPSNNVGFISLYTAKHYSQNLSGEMKPKGFNRLITSSLWGACALVFPRDVIVQILDHPLAKNWTGIAPKGLSDSAKRKLIQEKTEKPYLIQNVDTAIGQILNGIGLEMWCVDPSPVSHIATYSSIGHANNNSGKRNCLRCADHTKPLDMQVFPP